MTDWTVSPQYSKLRIRQIVMRAMPGTEKKLRDKCAKHLWHLRQVQHERNDAHTEMVAQDRRVWELGAEVERLRAELAAAEWAAQHVYQRQPTPDEVAHAMMLERELRLLDDEALLRQSGSNT